jgi:uncharacterized protein (DUF1015 family)
MARIFPFKAYMPLQEKVKEVASRAVENYSKQEINQILEINPISYLQVINPTKLNEPKENIRKRFIALTEKGVFEKTQRASYYIYRQSTEDSSYDGIIALADVADYELGHIKLHEQTLTRRENLLADYLDIVNLNAEPVCFTYPFSKTINEQIQLIQIRKPFLDFEEDDKTRHQIWLASDEIELQNIANGFAEIPFIYIADGHHRTASSVRLAHKRRLAISDNCKEKPYEHFLGIFLADNQLKILEFNRLIRQIDNFYLTELLEKLRLNFEVFPHNKNPFEPEHAKVFGMYVEGNWYELRVKNTSKYGDNPVENLDPEILNHLILEPCFGITDLKTDKKVGFISGKAGLDNLIESVDSGKYQIAFTLFPVSVKELFTIADMGLTMPPKSTWVEPKLLSGLTVYDLLSN